MLSTEKGHIILLYYTCSQTIPEIAHETGHSQEFIRKTLHDFQRENPSAMPDDPMSLTPEQGCTCAICQGWKDEL